MYIVIIFAYTCHMQLPTMMSTSEEKIVARGEASTWVSDQNKRAATSMYVYDETYNKRYAHRQSGMYN